MPGATLRDQTEPTPDHLDSRDDGATSTSPELDLAAAPGGRVKLWLGLLLVTLGTGTLIAVLLLNPHLFG